MPEFVEAKTTEQTAERNPFVIWYILQEHGFTCLGLCHDQAALPFPDG